MPAPRLRISSLPPLPASLRYLSELSDDKFSILKNELIGKDGLDKSSERVNVLAKILEESEVLKVESLLASLAFLYRRTREWADEDESTSEILRKFLEISDLWSILGEAAEKNLDRLASLLASQPLIDRESKLAWLRSGILDNAVGFSSFLDLRPDFNKERTKIQSFVPIIIFNVQVESDTGEDKSYTFQISEIGLNHFKKSVDDAFKKLDALRSDTIISDRIAFMSKDVD